MNTRFRGRAHRVLLIFAVILLISVGLPAVMAQSASGFSAFCHISDGTFTNCPGGGIEWSDVPVAAFPQGGSFLYADQADLDPARSGPDSPADTFMLMYDECGRTTPLGPNEYFLISFDTVEEVGGVEKLERYTVHIFPDNTILFIEDGHVEGERAAEVHGQRGDVGFGPSPNCPFDHVIAEYDIELEVAGGNSYSPDPLFWGGVAPEPDEDECQVTIDQTEGLGTMNVAEIAGFSADVSGGSGTPTYQWEVSGGILKDYDETINTGFRPIQMEAGDLRIKDIRFYWKDPVGARRVAVTVTAGEATCSDEVTINVERSSAIDKQAEDFYTEEHTGPGGRFHDILDTHESWHSTNDMGFEITYDGTLFFDFHNVYIRRFNQWRQEFGFSTIPEWNPAGTLPTGPDADHDDRPNTFNSATSCDITGQLDSCAKPSWFTTTGGTATRPSNGAGCDTSGGGEQSLKGPTGFPLNRRLLGCAVVTPWHNVVHGAIGGDMNFPSRAPRDPIFWRWHTYVDGVSQERMASPPQVVFQSPFRLYRFITGLASISVEFSEPVINVAAGDLVVNGSPATSVIGSGAGPYIFTGFAAPSLGSVTVAINPGSIIDVNESLPFGGDIWSYILINPILDSDADGVLDGEEADIYLSNPTLADTDADGMPDGFEIANICLSPLTNEAMPMDFAGNHLVGDDDQDDDGVSDFDEFLNGTNPCAEETQAIIDNGVVQIGIHREAQLNVPGGSPSSGTGTTVVGLRYLPTGAESTAPGCLCEGWGVADAISGVTGHANEAFGGVINITPLSFATTRTTAVSTVQIGSTFRVIHDYHPSITPNLYEASVTIENISSADVDARYRRVMDWDVEPTAFSEFVTVVTIQGSERAANVLFSSDDGFASADPLAGPSQISFTGDAVDSGPRDHGALFDFGFGTLRPGEKVTFNIYYGAAGTEDEAEEALATIRAEVYSFGQPNTVGGPNLGTPNTFIFAFSKVGGDPVFPKDSDGDTVLDELDNCPITPNTDQADSDLNGIGNACQSPDTLLSTAGFLQAALDGSTTAEPRSLRVGDEPGTLERLIRIVEFRIAAGLTDSPATLTANLVSSLVDVGLVSPGQADQLVDDVLEAVDVTEANLALAKSASSNVVVEGADLTYTLTVTNNGPGAATNVTLTDPLPPGVAFVSATPDQGTCLPSGGAVICDLGSLASGEDALVNIVVTTSVESTLTNSASVAASETDPDAANNTASVITFVVPAENFPPVLAADQAAVTVDEGATAANTGTISDRNHDPITFTASIGTVIDNGDGTWSWSYLTTDGPAETQTVTITADDGRDGITETTFELVVNNVAPTATFTNTTGEILQNGTAVLAFSGEFDPSPVDTAAGFEYSYDCRGDGDFELFSIAEASFACEYLDYGTFQAQGRIKDKDGDFTIYTAEVIVNKPNSEPEFGGEAIVTVDEGSIAINQGFVTDADGDFVLMTATLGTVVNNADGTFTWTFLTSDGPAESQLVTIFADDGRGGTSQQTFELVVNNVVAGGFFVNTTGEIVAGSSATFMFASTEDPGVADMAAGFLYSYRCTIDGPFLVEDSTSSSFNCAYSEPGFYNAVGRIKDKDGGFTDYIADINVIAPTNQMPFITMNQSSITIDEGQTAVNGGSFGDPDGDPLTLETTAGTVIDNGNGTWSWSFFADDGPSQSQMVTIYVSDAKDGYAFVSFPLTVNNVPPSATLENTSGDVSVGQEAVLVFSNQSDPSAADAAGGFSYYYDCNNDGTHEGDNVGPSYGCVYASAGAYTATGYIVDKDGLERAISTTVNVTE
jgi:uncharacterized repeat protein (TIGR01451 family)